MVNSRSLKRKIILERIELAISSDIALISVLCLAAILRVGHIFSLHSLPLFDRLIIDSEMYDKWAQMIAAGHWLGGYTAFYMDPLYSYVLAILYRIFGHDLLVVRLFQAGLGVATCALVGILGRRVGGKLVGTLAALFIALYRPSIFQEGEIEKTALGVFLVTASLVLALRKSVPARLCAGACLALAILTRGNLIIMVPLGTLYLLFTSANDEHEDIAPVMGKRIYRKISGKSVKHTVAFLLGIIVVFTPVVLRNLYVSGEWILTTSQAGQNFYTGNNPSNWVGSYRLVPFVRPQPIYEENDFRVKAEAMSGTRLTPREVSSFWFREAVKHMMEQPYFASLVIMRKFTLFWSDLEVPDGWGIYFIERYSLPLRLSFITFGWLLPLSVLGTMSSVRHCLDVRLLAGYVIAYACSVIAFFIFARYRMYIVPPLAVLAALGLQRILGQIRAQTWHNALSSALVVCGVCGFTFFGASTFIGLKPDNYVHNYIHLAEIYEEKNDFKSAKALLQEALGKQPKSEATLCAMGNLYLRTGDLYEAVTYFNKCIQENELYPEAWFFLGVTHWNLNNIDEARRCFQQQLAIIPDHRLSKEHLENLMSKQKDRR